MTKADLVERVTAQISRTAGPMISKKDCARVVDAFLEAQSRNHFRRRRILRSGDSEPSRFAIERREWLETHGPVRLLRFPPDQCRCSSLRRSCAPW